MRPLSEVYDWAVEKFAWIKSHTERGGLTQKDLLVLAPQNDPYAAPQPARQESARWFAQLWQAYGPQPWQACGQRGSHLRQFHYKLISLGITIAMPNGNPYSNTDECWAFLGSASLNARYLGLVDPTTFVDKRNHDAITYATPWRREAPTPGIDLSLGYKWSLPFITGGHFSMPPTPSVTGYDCSDQPYLMWIVIEKTTQNDLLQPLCRDLGLNLLAGAGFASLIRIRDLIGARGDKPVRIFEITDFDPAGQHMPTAFARQLQYELEARDITHDVKLTHLALTAEQVRHYKLPRIPIKETDRRKGNFEERYGEGAVELDALQALRPGELARLVREAVAPYIDATLERRLHLAEWEADTQVRVEWQALTADIQARLVGLQARIKAVTATHAMALARDLAPFQAELDALWQAVHDVAAALDPDLPASPVADVDPPDESSWLFDASRSYIDQQLMYKGCTPVQPRPASEKGGGIEMRPKGGSNV